VVGPGLSDVSVHYLSGMTQAIEHLAKLKHRKVAYIGGTSGRTISEHRVQAFKRAMQKAGLKVNPEYIRAGNYRISGGESAMLELLGMRDRPTAVLASNDLAAIGALRVLHRENVAVPDEISVVGFDDIELCDVFSPPLTTIRLPRMQLAEAFVTALEAARHDPHAVGKQYSVKTSLVIRSSTGPVKKKRG
jgi:LacI family transcriptional regulator